MTRQFNQTYKCDNCGSTQKMELPFRKWVRENGLLDSRKSALVIYDCDLLLHKYILHTDKIGSREIQAMMFIEVKTQGANITLEQRDTLSILSQMLRNRQETPTKKLYIKQATSAPVKVFSIRNNKYVRLFAFGGHLLQISGDSPANSDWMRWDNTYLITEDVLIKLLRFEIDPETLRPMEWRRHHKQEAPLFSKTS